MYENHETQLEKVILENKDLKRALKQLKNTIERTIDDYETLKTIHEEFKGHYQRQREELSDNTQRMQVMLCERRELESDWESKVRLLKAALDEKQRDLESAQGKLLPSLDSDMIRVRLLNEIEAPHRVEMDAKQAEIDRLLEKQYDLKRQLDISNARSELVQEETQRSLREMREKHKMELKDVMLEVQINQEKAIESKKERESSKMYKKEADDLRTEVFAKDDLIFTLKKNLDIEKDEKSEQIERLVGQLEDIREKHRLSITDNERQKEHITDLESEIKRSYERQNQNSIHSINQAYHSFSEQTPNKHINYQEEQLSQMRDHEWVVKSLQSRLQEQKNKFEEEIQTNRQLEKRMEVQIDKLRKEKRDLQSELNKVNSETGDKIAEERRKNMDLQSQLKDALRDKDNLSDQLRVANRHQTTAKLLQTGNKAEEQDFAKNQIEVLVKKNQSLKIKLKDANTKIVKLLSEKIYDKKREQDVTIMQQHNHMLKDIQESHLNGQNQDYNSIQGHAHVSSAAPENNIRSVDQSIRIDPQNQHQFPTNAYHSKSSSNQRILNSTTPVLQTANTSLLGGISSIHSRQNTGTFFGTEGIRTDLNSKRERLTNIRDHIEDIHRISNQQFYKPY